MRDAVGALASHARIVAPHWVEDDTAASFGARTSDFAIATLTSARADPNDPEHIRITYLWNGEEHVAEHMPPGTAWEPLLDRLEKALNVPATAIRAYRGPTFLAERQLKSRRSGG
jgi:hypothetical protein